MSHSIVSHVPLLGALCMVAGFVAHADIEECFELQRTIYAGTPIGQILVLKGYLSPSDLARMAGQRQHFRRTFCVALEDVFAAMSDAPPTPAMAIQSALPELGTFIADELDANPLFRATT